MKSKVSAQEQRLLDRILQFRYDPLAFALYAYPWGEKGTPLEGIKGPRKWQVEELQAIGAHVLRQRDRVAASEPLEVFRGAYSSGRGPGKTALFGMLANWLVSTWLGSRVVLAANSETQIRTTLFPEFGRWFTLALNSHWFLVDGMRVSIQPWLAEMVVSDLRVDPAQWGVIGKTWSESNPAGFRGEHNQVGMMLLFDESSGIPAEVWDNAEGFFTEPTVTRFHLAASQMHKAAGRFYDLFHEERFARLWRTRMMDVRGMEGIDPQWVADAVALHGEDSDFVRIHIKGQPPNQGETQFIATSVVREAQTREVEFDSGAPLMMGVDPAPRGRTAIRFRCGRDARSIPPVILQGADNVAIADRVVDLINKYNPDGIVVDAGMGTGVIDILKARRIRVHEVWFGSASLEGKEWATRGTELWAKLRDWLPGAAIDASADLFRDLTRRQWRWHGREETKKILESKEDAAARGVPSPDDGDALALTFHATPPRKDRHTIRTAHVHIAAGVDEDIFEVA